MQSRVMVDEVASESLAARLCRARQHQDYSRGKLSKLIGVTEATITRWEQGRAAPRSNRLPILAGTLGVSMRWLLSGQGDMSQPTFPDCPVADRENLFRELNGIARNVDASLQAMSRIEVRLAAIVRDASLLPD